MQSEMNKIFESTQHELDQENEKSKEMVQSSYQRLLQLKHKDGKPTQADVPVKKEPNNKEDGTVDVDNWEIEYED